MLRERSFYGSIEFTSKCLAPGHDILGLPPRLLTVSSAHETFNARVAASKFGNPPFSQFGVFGKSDTGKIALQGDHGAIAFRNIKIRVIKP